MTPEAEIARLEALLAEATPGPWRSSWDDPPASGSDYGAPVIYRDDHAEDPDGVVVSAEWYDGPLTACEQGNAALIVGAANALPSLLADARALREAVALLAEARDPVFFLAAARGMHEETRRRIDAFLAAHGGPDHAR